MSEQVQTSSRTCERGFTLVELLVALTVTVIGLAGLLSLHVAVLKGNQNASRTGEATTVAQQTLEDLRAMPIGGSPQSIVARYGALPITDVTMDPVDGRAGMVYIRRLWVNELTSVSEDLVMIRIEVHWTDDGADPNGADESVKHKIALELVRTRQEGL